MKKTDLAEQLFRQGLTRDQIKEHFEKEGKKIGRTALWKAEKRAKGEVIRKPKQPTNTDEIKIKSDKVEDNLIAEAIEGKNLIHPPTTTEQLETVVTTLEQGMTTKQVTAMWKAVNNMIGATMGEKYKADGEMMKTLGEVSTQPINIRLQKALGQNTDLAPVIIVAVLAFAPSFINYYKDKQEIKKAIKQKQKESQKINGI